MQMRKLIKRGGNGSGFFFYFLLKLVTSFYSFFALLKLITFKMQFKGHLLSGVREAAYGDV